MHYASRNSIYTVPAQEATGLTAFHISKRKKKKGKIAFMEQLQIKNISHIQQKVSSYFTGVFSTVLQSPCLFAATCVETNDNLITKSAALCRVFWQNTTGELRMPFQSFLISYQEALHRQLYLFFTSRHHLTTGNFRSFINTGQTARSGSNWETFPNHNPMP